MSGRAVLGWLGAGLGRAGRLGWCLLRGACVSRLGRAQPPGRALLAAALVLPAVLWLDRDTFDQVGNPADDGKLFVTSFHDAISLEMAVNRLVLGDVSAMTATRPAIHALLMQGEVAAGERLLDLPGRLARSPEEYAASKRPFLNNENSLLLLDWALLRLAPRLTLAGLARAHTAAKLIGLAAFAFVLLWAGFSPLLAGCALHLGLLVWAGLHLDQPLSLYPLLLPAVLLYLALLTSALAGGAHRRAWATALALGLSGAAACLLSNLRTSYMPLAAGLLLLYLVAAVLDLRRAGASGRRTGLLAALAVAAFAAGYHAFSAAYLAPIKVAAAGHYNYAHHVLGHPLVLGLAKVDPPHDKLARREGITWDDGCGLALARRIDPQVQYLDERYDAALLAYYAKLWLYYPGEMRDLYAAKLDVAGVDGFRYLERLAAGEEAEGKTMGLGSLGGRLSWPLGLLPRGSQWLVAFGLLALGALVAGRWLGAAASFALAGLAATAALLLLEAAAVLPHFDLQYHSLLLYCVLLTGLALYQLGLDATAWLLRAGARRVRRRFGRGDGFTAARQMRPARQVA
jgi:hypothetical protein